MTERTNEVNLLIDECERLKNDLENGNRGTSDRSTQNYVEEHRKLSRNINSLKKDNADLLDQNKNLQELFSEKERKLCIYKNYLKAICEKICKKYVFCFVGV